MRKQLKEASGLIIRAKEILMKVSINEKIPDNIKEKSEKIASALDVDIIELERMREY